MSGTTPPSSGSAPSPSPPPSPFSVHKKGEIGKPIETYVKINGISYKITYVPPTGHIVQGDEAAQKAKVNELATKLLEELGAKAGEVVKKSEALQVKFTKEHSVTSINKIAPGKTEGLEPDNVRKVNDVFTRFTADTFLEELLDLGPAAEARLAADATHSKTPAGGITITNTGGKHASSASGALASSAPRGVCGLTPLVQRDSSAVISTFKHTYKDAAGEHTQEINLGCTYYKSDFNDELASLRAGSALSLPSDREATAAEIEDFQAQFASLPSAFEGHTPVSTLAEAVKKTLPRGMQNPAEGCFVQSAIQNILAAKEQSDLLFATLDTIVDVVDPAINPTIKGLSESQIKSVIPSYTTTPTPVDHNAWDLSTLDKTQVLFCNLTVKQAAKTAKAILEKIRDGNKDVETKDLDAHTTQVLKMCLLKLQGKTPAPPASSTSGGASASLAPTAGISIPHINNLDLVNPDKSGDVIKFQKALLGLHFNLQITDPTFQSRLIIQKLESIIAADPANPTVDGLSVEQIQAVLPGFAKATLDDDPANWDLNTPEQIKAAFCNLTPKQAAIILKEVFVKPHETLEEKKTLILIMCYLKLSQETPDTSTEPLKIPHITDGFKDPVTTIAIADAYHAFCLKHLPDFNKLVRECGLIDEETISTALTEELATADSIDLKEKIEDPFRIAGFIKRSHLSFEIPIFIKNDGSGHARKTPLVFSSTDAGEFKVALENNLGVVPQSATFTLDSFSVQNSIGDPARGGHTWSYRRVDVSEDQDGSDLKWIRIDDREDPIVSLVTNEEVAAVFKGEYKNVYATYVHFKKDARPHTDLEEID